MAAVPGKQYISEARGEWESARRKARMAQFHFSVPGVQLGLHDFNDISAHLGLHHAIYRGVQLIPLDQIVGSVGRYQDFTGAFLPVDEGMRHRWERVAAVYLDPTSGGVPPIELYKVGTSYFVKDGNHRVSVARQLDLEDIEAYVWEYQITDSPEEDADIDTILLEYERREFLEQTKLDELRPRHNILITAPGGYRRMLFQIVRYQESLAKIDGKEVSWEYAVKAWYDMIYETSTQVIAETGVMDLFPDRTITDFFVWIRKHQEELEQHYGHRVTVENAARDFKKRNRHSIPERTLRTALRWAVGYFGV